MVGWQPNPSRRGAPAILESCVFTIIACTWSILHLNVPAPSDSSSTRLRRKIWGAVLTVFMPEVVLAHAIVERSAAVEALKELRSVSGTDGVIGDLDVDYVPWSWGHSMRGLLNALRKVLCC